MADEEVDWGVEGADELGALVATNGAAGSSTGAADVSALPSSGEQGGLSPLRRNVSLISSAAPQPAEKKPPTGPRSSLANANANANNVESQTTEASLPYPTVRGPF